MDARCIISKAKFVAFLKEKGSTLIGEYVNLNTPVKVRCKNGHEFEYRPQRMNRPGNWCLACDGKTPEQIEQQFIKAVAEKKGKILGKFINKSKKVKVECHCGNIWDANAGDVIRGHWCLWCADKSPEKAKERFMEAVKKRNGKIHGEFISTKTYITVECEKGHVWETKPNYVSTGNWCIICSGNSKEEAEKRLIEKVEQRDGEILSPYVNGRTKMKFKCRNGHEFDLAPMAILSVLDNWCRFCRESKGENYTNQHLINLELSFKREHPVKIGKYEKYFDFLVFLENGEKLLIEFDGKQHFESIPYYDKDRPLSYRRLLDEQKTQWAVDNNHHLLRISYRDIKNIEKIIDSTIKLIEENPDGLITVPDDYYD